MVKDPNPPKLKIEWIEFESPFFEQWPPTSHTHIMFPNNDKLAEPDYASEVIKRFATRAYRGPVEKERNGSANVVLDHLSQGSRFARN